MKNRLILASSSAYRRELLARLQLPFSCQSPAIDESPLPKESPSQLALRLARQKAEAVALHQPAAIVIGSDQVAAVDGVLLGKPGTEAKAVQQLMLCTGKRVTFYTGLCVQLGKKALSDVVEYSVEFRDFDEDTALRYIRIEQPLDCAGSFKCEGLGVSLFKRQCGDDPTSLIGLPLIRSCEFLREFGVAI